MKRADGVCRKRKGAYWPLAAYSPPRPKEKAIRPMGTVLHVCTTCKGQAFDPETDGLAPRPGRLLADALSHADLPPGVTLREVECLSACSQGCAVTLSAPGKWAYVYGRLTPDDAAEILRGAGLYAASPDGVVVWRDRPQIFRKQSLARIPPMES
jgi:predicted metal-binding protein